MAVELDVELVSPEDVTYSGTAEMVIVRTVEEGDIAFQAGHVPFLGVLAPWSVDVLRPGGERDTFAVHRRLRRGQPQQGDHPVGRVGNRSRDRRRPGRGCPAAGR